MPIRICLVGYFGTNTWLSLQSETSVGNPGHWLPETSAFSFMLRRTPTVNDLVNSQVPVATAHQERSGATNVENTDIVPLPRVAQKANRKPGTPYNKLAGV